MPTAALAARAGLIAISTAASAGNADTIAELRNIRLNVTRVAINAASMDSSGWDEFIYGQIKWEGTGESIYVPSTANSQYNTRTALANSTGTTVSIIFQPSTATPYTWSGSAIMTDWDIIGAYDGAFMSHVSFVGTAGLTYATST